MNRNGGKTGITLVERMTDEEIEEQRSRLMQAISDAVDVTYAAARRFCKLYEEHESLHCTCVLCEALGLSDTAARVELAYVTAQDAGFLPNENDGEDEDGLES